MGVFFIKEINSFYCDSHGGQPDELILQKVTKLITFHKYKIQDINSRFCATH